MSSATAPSEIDQPPKVAFVADYPPRKCGIATFTHDLLEAVAAQHPEAGCGVLAVNDLAEGYHYPPEVRFEIQEQRLRDYRDAADFLRFNGFDVLCLQHEFGIYGGSAGSHILALLDEVRLPVVTTLHTVLTKPSPDQRLVMNELVRQSERLVVMTERGRSILQDVYRAPLAKIDLIAHGIPDTPFVDPNLCKEQFGFEGKRMLLTFGLLSPSKGIEYVIQALPEITRQHSELIYVILGVTHPNLLRTEGELYRLELERLTAKLGMQQHVAFHNRFVELDELKLLIGAADIYITPYLNKAQITSGTLCYAFGCGKAVVSTPYWHAEELLADDRGVLVPFKDSPAIASAISGLLQDEARLRAMCARAYLLGRETTWERIAWRYFTSFRQARADHRHHRGRRFTVRTLAQQPLELPELTLDHVDRLTDATGMFQHAVYAMPSYTEGYCSDDNARALLLMVLLEPSHPNSLLRQRLATTYAAFIQYAFDNESGRFRNFMNFDRRWRDEPASDDCFGRCIWALGVCLGRSKHRSFQKWAAELFLRALPGVEESGSPRSWAFTLLGIQEYRQNLSGDSIVAALNDRLTARLILLYGEQSDESWPWFEPVLSYANAALPHALISSGRHGGAHAEQALELGLRTLRWLVTEQTRDGHFAPIGSDGFYRRDGARARFDQQPIEAHATVSACIEAFEVTQDAFWRDEAQRAFEWFLGRNDLDLPLYNPASGGCYDGLHFDRVNLNQGAESTLAFLLALAELQTLLNPVAGSAPTVRLAQ